MREFPTQTLPIPLTPFIGRVQEILAVQDRLRRENLHLLTLTGPGGSGKTRLALRVASELGNAFSDGVYFVNLAPLHDPALVVPTIAQTLDIKEAKGQPFLALVRAFLQEKHTLLLLDNFEQVLDAAIPVGELLAACPRLRILVTSRAALHLRGEWEFAVPPLSCPDPRHLPDLGVLPQYEAVALFLQQAQAVKPDFQLTLATAQAIAEICVRLDGLPLAIELASARIKLFPPSALLARLGQRLAVLTGGPRDAPARQQTLRDTLAWSYHLLDAQEQRLFRLLSIFVGGCTLEAIESVSAALGDDMSSVLDRVASLIDKNLLLQIAREEEPPRLAMLETIREFGMEMLTQQKERETTRAAHAAYYLALAEEAAQEYSGPQLAEWLERLEREHDNLRAAMAWSLESAQAGSRLEMASRLGEALTKFWQVRNYHSEARAFLEQVLSRSEGNMASVSAKMLDAAASFAFALEDNEQAERWWQESLARYRQLGDIRGIASSLLGSGLVALKQNKSIAGLAQLEESLAFAKGSGDLEAIAESLLTLANRLFTHAVDYRRAGTLVEEGLTIYRVLGDKPGIAGGLIGSAIYLFFTGQGDEATIHQRLAELLAISRELGDKHSMMWYYWVEGWIAFRQGDTQKAQDLIVECLALCRETGMRWYICWALAYLGRIRARQGDFAAAYALLLESLAEAHTLDDLARTACLERLASVVAAQGKYAWATHLLSVAESLRENIVAPASPMERADYEPALTEARMCLGERAFVAAWAEGKNMTFEQVIAAARRLAVSSQQPSEEISQAPVKQARYPAGLTTREVEVLRLVAQGLTDAQVAVQLVISPGTVNSHLKSIYGKIQVSSRSAATRFAIENHLI